MSECLSGKNKRIKTWLGSDTPEIRPHQKNRNNDCDWFHKYTGAARHYCCVTLCEYQKEDEHYGDICTGDNDAYRNCKPPPGEVYCSECEHYNEAGINDLIDDHTSQWGGAGPDCIAMQLVTAH